MSFVCVVFSFDFSDLYIYIHYGENYFREDMLRHIFFGDMLRQVVTSRFRIDDVDFRSFSSCSL